METLTSIIREKKKLSIHFKKKIQKTATKYNFKIDSITRDFETAAERITKEQESKTKLLIKEYNKSFNSIKFKRSYALLPALRNKVKEEICEYYGFNIEDVDTETRGDRTKAECRQVIYYFMLYHQLGTLKEIGEVMGRKPATILMGSEAIGSLLDVDNVFRANFNNMKERIGDIVESAKTA